MGLAAFVGPTGADPASIVLMVGLALPSVLLGLLLVRRDPGNLTGPALVLVGAVPVLVQGVETWGSTVDSAEPWPVASLMAQLAGGVWVFLLAGFVVLCLVFPVGPLPGRPWNLVAGAYVGTAVLIVFLLAMDPTRYAEEGGPIPGAAPVVLGGLLFTVAGVLALVLLLAVLFTAASAVVVRWRRGDETVREQMRWFMAGALTVPTLLASGWIAQSLGASTEWSYSGFLLAMLVILPLSVYIAIEHKDLFDIDRLLSQGASWVLTAVVAAGLFAIIVAVVSASSGFASSWGPPLATFATALVLLPLHGQLRRLVSRAVDHDRSVALGRVTDFVRQTRTGEAQPEEIEVVLREALNDPHLHLLIRVPGSDEFVSLDGQPAERPLQEIPLDARGAQVGSLTLGRWSSRRERLAREAVSEARLPIEVSRMRLELRQALDEIRASRARLVEAVSDERLRLERDLHDGAQQQLVAIGMRLRSVQHRWPLPTEADTELDAAVEALSDTVAEIRRLANGIRPGRLSDGLPAAIRGLVHDCPIPVRLELDEVDPEEAVAVAAYYVVAESLANALKHAHASCVDICVGSEGGRLHVTVTDDGDGGAVASTGLTRLGDRVEALGGRLAVASPAGQGTRVEAVI